MNDTTKIMLAAALAGGYVLGRTKKGRFALTAASFLAGRQFGLEPRQLLAEGVRRLGEIPQVADLGKQLSGEVLEAGRQAVATAANSGLTELADALHDRTLQLEAGGATEEEEEGEGEREGEEEPDERPRRGASRRTERGGAAKKAGQRPTAKKTGATKKSAKKAATSSATAKEASGKKEPEKKAPAKKSSARKSTAKKAGTKAPAKTGPAKKSVKKTTAKSTKKASSRVKGRR
ncbi:histone protein [Streptomyces chattanoogensis]|uniref:histone protein n=1 Tax=Streptomyces chattanoogensis TaxID=66876 RepID=UPI0036B7E833